MEKEALHQLVSRGLDGDLDREEMARLYRSVAEDPSLAREMGEMARLQGTLDRLSQQVVRSSPRVDLTARAVEKFRQARKKEQAPVALLHRVFRWFHSPQGLAVQPFSFVGGVVAVLLVVWFSPSLPSPSNSNPEPVANRLNIHDVQFVNAQARVKWTNQFIIPPGGSTRLSLDHGREPESVQIQFEAVEPTKLTLTHLSLTRKQETVRSVVVTGIGYATLRQPRSGDVVSIDNHGQIPVLVYMRTAGGVTVSDNSDKNISRSL